MIFHAQGLTHLHQGRPAAATRQFVDLRHHDDGAMPEMGLLTCSGTAALAIALHCAKKLHPLGNKRQVIIPGYGCPDLVSAVVHAGLVTVLVDLEADSHQLSHQAIQRALTEKTLPIVAVNFLGLPGRLPNLRQITDSAECLLIEDNAQWFPEPEDKLYGDFVITSFGRGKPVNLLGGGLLLTNNRLQLNTLSPRQHDRHYFTHLQFVSKSIAIRVRPYI